MINGTEQNVASRPIRGLTWLLIGCEELLLFVGFISISWFSSSASLCILESSLFLMVVSLLQIVLVAFVWRTKKLRMRLFASFRLIPFWQGTTLIVTFIRLLIYLPILIIIIWGSELKIITFPNYWWDIVYRFLLVSVDLSVLFPLALKALATPSNKGTLNLQRFLISWTILTAGWLGGLVDFEEHLSSPKIIGITAWIALIIVLFILPYNLARFSQGDEY